MSLGGESPRLSPEQFEERIAEQVRALRIRNNIDQATLADLSNVSLGTIQNLERAKGSSLRTLVKVVRALGQEQWLENLDPIKNAPSSPMQQLRIQRQATRPQPRVRRAR